MKTNPLSISEIEKISSKVRRNFGISDDEYFPILEVLDDMFLNGIISIQFLDNDDPIFESDTPAKYNSVENFIYIKNSVLDEYEEGNYRACFTLAHELFHYIQNNILGFDFYNENNFLIIERKEPKIDESFFESPYLPVEEDILYKYSPKKFVQTVLGI